MRTGLVFLAMLIGGCAFHQTPYVMYEGDVPLANTAVFSSLDDRATPRNESRIHSVDGKPTSCVQAGCPYWVRVLPGAHQFLVRYLLPGIPVQRYANVPVQVPDMKPRHVYVARYQLSGNTVRVTFEDLGEDPDYGIPLGLEGTRYRAKF